jgi:hypothetical protein
MYCVKTMFPGQIGVGYHNGDRDWVSGGGVMRVDKSRVVRRSMGLKENAKLSQDVALIK